MVTPTIDFAPSKLKQDYGEQALFVLDTLWDQTFKAVKFKWNTLMPPREEDMEDEEIYNDAEVDTDKVEEDMAGVQSEEDEGDILHIDDISNSNYAKPEIDGSRSKIEVEKPVGIMDSTTEAFLQLNIINCHTSQR